MFDKTSVVFYIQSYYLFTYHKTFKNIRTQKRSNDEKSI